jgi:hypothetical protein
MCPQGCKEQVHHVTATILDIRPAHWKVWEGFARQLIKIIFSCHCVVEEERVSYSVLPEIAQ